MELFRGLSSAKPLYTAFEWVGGGSVLQMRGGYARVSCVAGIRERSVSYAMRPEKTINFMLGWNFTSSWNEGSWNPEPDFHWKSRFMFFSRSYEPLPLRQPTKAGILGFPLEIKVKEKVRITHIFLRGSLAEHETIWGFWLG